MDDDSHVIDKGWDALPDYAKSGDADDAVTLSISTTPGEWLVNTNESVVVPMSMAEVVDAVRHHKLTERSLVWRAGMQEWAPLEKVPQLKLAARLAPVPASSPPAPSAPPPSAAAHGRPASKTPPQRPSQPQQLSRRSTLPFGLPSPNTTARPSQPRLSSPVSAPPHPSEEQEVLAVYARPAATISFDLSPSEPARALSPAAAPAVSTPPAHTLVPTTSDAHRSQRWQPPSSPADLSVVAASQFRAVQRSSKRVLWVSSLASAVAASVLTLWVSGAAPWKQLGAANSAPPAAAAAVAARLQAPAATPVVAPPPSLPSAAPAPVASAAPPAEPPPAVATPAPSAAPKVAAKPAARKPKAVSRTPATPRPAIEPTGGEPNPNEVKLDDEAAQAAQPSGKPVSRGLLDMMQESEQKAAEPKEPEASATSGSSSPGF
jgi:hypothetical protein